MAFYFKLKCLLIVCQKKKKMFTYKTFYILSYENLNLYKYRLIMDEVPVFTFEKVERYNKNIFKLQFFFPLLYHC